MWKTTSTRNLLHLIFLWLAEVPVSTVVVLMESYRNTSIQKYQYFRNICFLKMVNKAFIIQLNVVDHVV